MRYITSIIATLFTLLLGGAYAMQLYIYNLTSPAQIIALSAVVISLVLIVISETTSIATKVDPGLSHRLISSHTIFPSIAFIIQYLIALAYSFAWYPLWNLHSQELRAILPEGIFIPLGIQLIIFTPVIVLWVAQSKANEQTRIQHAEHVSKQNYVTDLITQAELLRAVVSKEDTQLYNRILQKTESLPLNIKPSCAPLLQQAYQEMMQLTMSGVVADRSRLERLLEVVSRIR